MRGNRARIYYSRRMHRIRNRFILRKSINPEEVEHCSICFTIQGYYKSLYALYIRKITMQAVYKATTGSKQVLQKVIYVFQGSPKIPGLPMNLLQNTIRQNTDIIRTANRPGYARGAGHTAGLRPAAPDITDYFYIINTQIINKKNINRPEQAGIGPEQAGIGPGIGPAQDFLLVNKRFYRKKKTH